MFESALELGEDALSDLGYSKHQSHRIASSFRFHDNSMLNNLYGLYNQDKSKYINESRRMSEQLEEILKTEKEHSYHESDMASNSSTLREEVRSNVRQNIKRK